MHENAEKQGPDVAAQYAAKHAERCFKQGEYGQAAHVLAQHGVSASPAFFELYRSVASAILSSNSKEKTVEAEDALKVHQ